MSDIFLNFLKKYELLFHLNNRQLENFTSLSYNFYYHLMELKDEWNLLIITFLLYYIQILAYLISHYFFFRLNIIIIFYFKNFIQF